MPPIAWLVSAHGFGHAARAAAVAEALVLQAPATELHIVTAVLERFVRAEMAAVEIDRDELESGDWLDRVEGLLAAARPTAARPQGADDAARLILERLSIG
jgi:hypothetical protein